jgi:DNA-binding NarL/FixJ family response regulator
LSGALNPGSRPRVGAVEVPGVTWVGESTAEYMSGAEKIRVLIADDQRLFAGGISRILAAQPDIEVVGEAHNGKEAVEFCKELLPDVVLMDLSMPVMDGVSATREIRDVSPGTSILILTMHTDDEHVFRGIKAGAKGYVLKDCTPEDLTRAIRAVHAGDTIMAPEIARKLMTTFESEEKTTKLSPALTRREMQVLASLSRGHSNKEVARDLDISEKTVRNHASNIYRKLHIFDRTQAVLYAIREGLVDLEDL